MQAIITVLLWFALLSCGLLAGLYFAFSAFIMTALGEIDRPAGISAMNAINRVILRSTFMPLFLGSTMASIALAIIGLLSGTIAGGAAMVTGGVLYSLGMTGVTMIFNVPLNNMLIRAETNADGSAQDWKHYLRRWTLWNHVRTLASTGAMMMFALALVCRA